MADTTPAILIFEGDGAEGGEDLRSGIRSICGFGPSIRISNVYQFNPGASDSLKTTVALSLQGVPNLDAAEALVKQAQKEGRGATVTLVALGGFFVRDSRVVLPHPELHLKPHWLMPAAEIEGSYVHPVFRKSLLDLAERYRNRTWGAFYCRGQSLLDFSDRET